MLLTELAPAPAGSAGAGGKEIAACTSHQTESHIVNQRPHPYGHQERKGVNMRQSVVAAFTADLATFRLVALAGTAATETSLTLVLNNAAAEESPDSSAQPGADWHFVASPTNETIISGPPESGRQYPPEFPEHEDTAEASSGRVFRAGAMYL